MVRDFLLEALFARIGKPGSFRSEGKSTRFELNEAIGEGNCSAEAPLEYTLPNGRRLTHKSDLLFSLARESYISVELKCLSAVTDQFKARTYDMLHMKQTYGEKLRGIMVYVHVPGNGISLQQARAISYSFDHFVPVETRDLADVGSWLPPILSVLEERLKDKR